MSGDRLNDVRQRIAATRQLDSVFTAMRGVASVRAQDARRNLEGVRAYARTLGETISVALALAQEEQGTRRSRAASSKACDIVLAFCAEQGFVGAFNERVLAAATQTGMGASLFLVGERGVTVAAERGIEIAWSTSMAAHADDAPILAERIAEALYGQLAVDATARVTLVHCAPAAAGENVLVTRSLIPLDLTRFPAPRVLRPPLVNLPPQLLIANLAEEYIFAELCEAVALSLAAENVARMQAMTTARNNVRQMLDQLTARFRHLRQEQITEELLEISRL
ncbi:F0F1 ATP synthase subunit gamma [Methylocystis sp.]|uniref:F0F1 ATP synthase subunit gamma n=1 Tax=Methylocystis sp. TaxID=1911079 RepID=UPI003D135F20